MASSIIDVSEANFEREVLKSGLPVMIVFYTSWAKPCADLMKTFEVFAGENQRRCKAVRIDVDVNNTVAAAFGIKSVPTIVTMRGSKAYLGAVGNQPLTVLAGLVEQTLKEIGEDPPPEAAEPEPGSLRIPVLRPLELKPRR